MEHMEPVLSVAAPLVRGKAKFIVKNAVCPSLPFAAYGDFEAFPLTSGAALTRLQPRLAPGV